MHNLNIFDSIDHRLFPKADYDQMANDVALAVKWVNRNADPYQMDQSKLNLMGHSAGGQYGGYLCMQDT
ncbi:alpha/beta hydrolase [Bacillota bacterium Lsc_1132]